MTEPRPRLIVFISGSGSNLQAILDAISAGRLTTEVVLVVSNRKAAFGLTRAEQAGIPTLYFPLKPYIDSGQSREQYDANLAERVAQYQPNLLVLAGWMHVFTSRFLEHFPRRVINLHPASPGLFPGVEAIRRTYEAYQGGKVRGGGCMVHYVVPEVDAGEVITQAFVPIEPDDSLETFETRMHTAEHKLIVEAIQSVLT